MYIDEEGTHAQEKSLLRQLKIALYHNLAAGYLRLKDHKNALLACHEALAIDPRSNL
jgi:hypothetical protein